MKLLVAEDSPLSLELLCENLRGWGHEVIGVKNGLEAWERLQQEEFSIVLSDWLMPGMDGVELVRRIRASQRAHYVFFILLTAKSQTDDVIRGMDAGADDFLTKPFDLEELHVRLRAGERVIALERKLSEQNHLLDQANQRMKLDLLAAAHLQQSLLPAASPDIPGVTVAWSYRPCEELGGDFLNIFPLADNHLGLYVVDVSGHGVAAALLSVAISRVLTPETFLSSLPGNGESSANGTHVAAPAEVAGELNRRFPMEKLANKYFTIVYGTLNLTTREFRFVSASHPPMILLVPGKKPKILKTKGYAIGWFPESLYEDHVVQLTAGSRIFFYTDGLMEATNPGGEQFGIDRLATVLDEKMAQSLPDAIAALITSLESWCDTSKARDDWSILGLEVDR